MIHVHMYIDVYVEMSNESYNPAVCKKCSFTESWEEALISQTLNLVNFSDFPKQMSVFLSLVTFRSVGLIHGIGATSTCRNSCLKIFFF